MSYEMSPNIAIYVPGLVAFNAAPIKNPNQLAGVFL